MGEKQSKTLKDQLSVDPKQWTHSRYENGTWVLTNSLTNRQGEQSLVHTDPNQDLQHQLQIYYYRKVQQNALVSVYAVENLSSKNKPLCGNSDSIKVIYERIPRRLGNLQKLSFPEALYFLSQCFRGFKDCYQKVGLFDITEDMIGVNTDGQVKVWLNQNYALNHPTVQRPSLQITSTNTLKQASGSQQKVMINNIVSLIQNRTETKFPSSFKSQLKNCLTFVDAYCQIQKYVTQKQIWIPDRLPSSSVIEKDRKNQSKVSQFKSQLISQRNSNVNSHMSQPHASYIPNVQYCEPRMTYVASPKASREGARLRTIQVSFNNSNKTSNSQSFAQNAVASMPPYNVSSPKHDFISPMSKASSPYSLALESNAPDSFISPFSKPQSPKINFLHPTSPKS